MKEKVSIAKGQRARERCEPGTGTVLKITPELHSRNVKVSYAGAAVTLQPNKSRAAGCFNPAG